MSCGPGLASGWYWTEKTGSESCARPSTDPSFRLTWLTRKPLSEGNRRGVHLEPVILGGDVGAARFQVLDGLVGAAVAVGQAAGGGADCQAENLVAQADAHERSCADQVADGIDGPIGLLGVAGAVADHHAVRVGALDFAALAP